MNAAEGGYYTEGRTVDTLRRGAASLVIYANGKIAITVPQIAAHTIAARTPP